jgi:thiamine transport system substrate-binding protein
MAGKDDGRRTTMRAVCEFQRGIRPACHEPHRVPTMPNLFAAKSALPSMRALMHGLAGLAICAIAGLTGAQAQDAQKPSLTVYTYSSFSGKYGPGKAVKDRFEAQCGCTLTFVNTDDAGSLLARLKLEGNNTRADVVIGLDNNLMAEARETGLFAPHGQDKARLTLPVAWSDDTFLPFDFGWFAFVHDADKLKTPPASLRELIENPNGPRIVIQDPRTSTPGLGLNLWMRQVFGDLADAAWAKLKPRVVTVTKGWSEAYGLFLKGEADMVLSYTTSPAYHIGVEKKTNYKAAMFSEGHYLQVEVAARLRTSQNEALARRFMDFVASEAFQSAMPEGNWMYPAITPAAGLPASFANLPKPARTLQFAPDEVRANRRAFIDGWLGAMSR